MSMIHSPSEMFALLKDIQKRSQQSAAALSQQDNTHGSWTAIGFRVAEHHLLIPLTQASEIFPVPDQITLVPKSKPWVFGVANLRGELLPLFDLKYFLYGQATKVNKYSRIIVSNHPEIYSGLLLDEVFGLKHFQHEPDSVNRSTVSAISGYITASINQQETQWDVFSFDKLATDQRFLNAAM